MNPPKSLMALGAAIVLAAPCVARADDAAGEWQALKTRPTYFVHLKSDSAPFSKMKEKKFRGPLPLWIDEKKKDGTLVKVEAGATLNCASNKAKVWSCWIDVNAKQGGKYQISGVDIGAQVAKKASPAPADQKPEGVSPEVWAAVVRSGKVKPANWAKAAQDVEAALKQAPHGEKMRASGRAGMEQLLAGVESEIESGGDDSKVIKRAVDLSEKIASGGSVSAPGAPEAHGAPVDQGDKDASRSRQEENPINALTKELAKPEVQADMAKRVVAFVTHPDGGAVYVDAKGHEQAAAAQLEKALTEGVTKLNATQQDRGRAAVLYFLLGEPGKPQWLDDFNSLHLMADPLQARGYFKDAMKRWTAAGAQTPGQADAGPYKGDANWPAQFLKDALDKADQVMHDQRVQSEIAASIAKFAQHFDVPDGVAVSPGGAVMPGNNDLRNLIARSFTADDMYRNGAYVQDVLIPGSKPPRYRTISMKIYSQQIKYGPPPVVEDRLGIFDITDVSKDGGRTPSNIFGQYFPLNQRGDSTFLLDDRDSKSVRYKLSMGGGGISFVPVNKDGKTPVGDPVAPTIQKLYDLRNDELASAKQSYMANLNGQNFRVIPQGGPHGQLVYFAADKNGNRIGDTPVLTSDLSEVNANTGQTQIMRTDRPLGYIGKDAGGNPQFWYLVWNDKLQAYEARAGKAPKDDPYDPMHPPAPPAKDDGKGKGKDDSGNVGSSTSTAPGGQGDAGDADSDPNRPDATVSGGDEWACDFKSKFPKAPTFELYRLHDAAGGEKWRMYTDGTGAALSWNQTYLCAYGTYALWFEGLIPKKIPKLPAHSDQAVSIIGTHDDGYLDVMIVKNAPGADGNKLIMPKDASNLVVGAGGGLAYGDNVQGNVDSAEEYVIPLKNLKQNIHQSNDIAAGAHVAWVKLLPDFVQPNQNPLMFVFLRPGDDVKAVLSKAVRDYGGTNTICKSGDAIAPQLLSYFDTVAADPKLKEEFDGFKATDANSQPPHVTLSCLTQQTGGTTWDVATTSWGLSSGVLRAVKGKLVSVGGSASK